MVQLTPQAGVRGEGHVSFLMVLAPLGHGAPEEQPLCSYSSQDSRMERSLRDAGSCAVAVVLDSLDWALKGCLAKLYIFPHPVSNYDLFLLPLVGLDLL